jgi:hypothetical protein
VRKGAYVTGRWRAREYVRRGLSYPHCLCERQDRCNNSFDEYDRSLTSPIAQAYEMFVILVYHIMQLRPLAAVGQASIDREPGIHKGCPTFLPITSSLIDHYFPSNCLINEVITQELLANMWCRKRRSTSTCIE